MFKCRYCNCFIQNFYSHSRLVRHKKLLYKSMKEKKKNGFYNQRLTNKDNYYSK